MDVFLFLLFSDFSFLKAVFHRQIIAPVLRLFLKRHLLELTLHSPLLQFHLFLSQFPILLMHHHHVLLVSHRILILFTHHIVHLGHTMAMLLFCFKDELLASPQPWFMAWKAN